MYINGNGLFYLFILCFLFGGTICYEFPANVKFGVATAAYQTEGAWNSDGRTESIWDYQAHTFPQKIIDKSNGDIACDSYNKIDEDVINLKLLNVDFYRFSISWSRILPTGFPNVINDAGVQYYKKLITKLLENNIEPIVTIYHWDMPQSLQDLGGWANQKMADYFADYAKVCFELFGDEVKTWITINEPIEICQYAYGDSMLAPFIKSDGIGSYLCGHTVILAHAKAYHIYNNIFRELQKGKIGITIESSWFEPATDSHEDKQAAETMIQMYYGWFAHPIFSKEGDYPAIMRSRIDYVSKIQGFTESRLPTFTTEEVDQIRGSSDFLGLNHYTTFMTAAADTTIIDKVPSYLNDIAIKFYTDEKWKGTARSIFKVVPWGLRKLLNWIKMEYNNPEIFIMENGYAGFQNETTHDCERIHYFSEYLKAILEAIHEDKCKVIGYTAWSYMDNYEWNDGYTMRFGLYHVDFNDPERPRVPKLSADFYRNVIFTREINEDLINACSSATSGA